MRLELKITESQALLEVHAVSDFEKETLCRLKRSLPVMLTHLEVEHRDYYGYDVTIPKSASISIDFLPPQPCPPDNQKGGQG